MTPEDIQKDIEKLLQALQGKQLSELDAVVKSAIREKLYQLHNDVEMLEALVSSWEEGKDK